MVDDLRKGYTKMKGWRKPVYGLFLIIVMALLVTSAPFTMILIKMEETATKKQS